MHESTVKKIKIIDGKKDQSMFKEIRKDNVELDMGGTAPNARIGEIDGIFPPRMPSEHFLLDTQRPEDELLNEEEYIKKYKNGEITKELAYPPILEKLEAEKKMEIISNHNNINNNKIGDQLILKSKTKEIDKNFEKSEKINNNIIDKRNEIIIQQRKALIERQQRIHKVKTFISKGWEFNEEYINQKLLKF